VRVCERVCVCVCMGECAKRYVNFFGGFFLL